MFVIAKPTKAYVDESIQEGIGSNYYNAVSDILLLEANFNAIENPKLFKQELIKNIKESTADLVPGGINAKGAIATIFDDDSGRPRLEILIIADKDYGLNNEARNKRGGVEAIRKLESYIEKALDFPIFTEASKDGWRVKIIDNIENEKEFLDKYNLDKDGNYPVSKIAKNVRDFVKADIRITK